ncbi:response regulator [Deinococcus aquatilis]|jgi:CheY-like chemotaxis protein|uniref:response regulator n=1 Tax=Deinococcus aquatilis TaxID=519440 RepID=UPI00037494D0|nr:response regulator [Deinococcus aquatilis]
MDQFPSQESMTAVMVRRVLIIEDCLEDALLLGLAFEDHAPEVQVEAISDGATALAYVQSAEPPQVVVLDLHLPGQTGVEVLKQLQEVAGAVQVVCWSSHAHPKEVEAVLACGAAYLEKPREITGFGRLVQTLLTL